MIPKSEKFDLHLSAIRISRKCIEKLEEIGFVRDEFTNNTRCIASDYHATFRKRDWTCDPSLWADICNQLARDEHFIGCLEEERIDSALTCEIDGSSAGPLEVLSALPITAVPAGKHKECDLHLSVNLNESTPAAVQCVENLQVAAFDKPTSAGIRRVFTITCEESETGERLFVFLRDRLNRIRGLKAKLKMERTMRCFRHPPDAPMLPLSPSSDLNAWLLTVGCLGSSE